jgi:hypothetical protein
VVTWYLRSIAVNVAALGGGGAGGRAA